MLNLKNKKTRATMLVALFALMLGVGAVSAHAQAFCRMGVAHPNGHGETVCTPYGCSYSWVPCTHWISICDF